MTFGDWLREKRTEKGYSLRELSRRANGVCTHGYISQLEKNTGGKKGTYQPDLEIVDSLAKALHTPIDEARLAAGYAPKTLTRKPETIPELVEALAQLGIEAPQPFGGYPADDDGEGFREVVERIWLDIQMVNNRLTKGRNRPTIQNLELSDFDIDEEINKRKTS